MPDTIGWLTLDELRNPELWPDGARLSVATLELVSGAAYGQCLRFLGHEDDDPAWEPPAGHLPRLKMAQLYQTKAVWRSSRAGSDDGLGGDGMTVTLYPLDQTVRQMLAPPRRKPPTGARPRQVTP